MNSMTNDLHLYSRLEAQELLGLGRDKLNEIIKSGKIKFLMIGNRIKIPYMELKNFIEENLVSNDDVNMLDKLNEDESSTSKKNKTTEFDAKEYLNKLRKEIN